MAAQCSTCGFGRHSQCRDHGCACTFPMHIGRPAPAVLSHRVTGTTALVPLVPSGPVVTGRVPPPAPEIVEVERVRVEKRTRVRTERVEVEVEKIVLVPLEIIDRPVLVERDKRQSARWLTEQIVACAELDPALAAAATTLLRDNGWSGPAVRLLARVLVDELSAAGPPPKRLAAEDPARRLGWRLNPPA